ncbi:hypothetical protein SARC_12453 [Sphaeroforma arctica JP610]|uniref:Uncharacterized protein n=1 Tax=Sphaeroforma arctica JP610 TaxID=667725 RepID=A0A0L0FE17_9EUKA|nr:hypothetical protein SARC_12453 [Sphaeroforma arctica JP610]KNC75012.1 hypothetical protein SARC_12453 [Sphaeroforma arctica JP610]|eukprot:XP_014148914.1 hypothetical protein SARC_12453 [Sphaeroforma arctica JP610]
MDANMQDQVQAHAENIEEAITQAAKVVSATVAPVAEKIVEATTAPVLEKVQATSDAFTDQVKGFDYQPYLDHAYDAYEQFVPYVESVSGQVYNGYVSAAGEMHKFVETSTEQARLFADHIELEDNLHLARQNAYKAYERSYEAAIKSSEVLDEYLVSSRAQLQDYDHVIPLGFLPAEHERYEPLVLLGSVMMALTIITWAVAGTATPIQNTGAVDNTEDITTDANDDAMPTPMSTEEAAERLAADRSVLNMSLNRSSMNDSFNASGMMDIPIHENKENSFIKPANVSVMGQSNNTSLLSKSNNNSMMEKSLPLGVKSVDSSFHNNNNRSQLNESFAAKSNNTSFALGPQSTNASMIEKDLDTSKTLDASSGNIGQTA